MFRCQHFCFFALTPETRHPKIWCLEFGILQYSTTPLLQITYTARHSRGIQNNCYVFWFAFAPFPFLITIPDSKGKAVQYFSPGQALAGLVFMKLTSVVQMFRFRQNREFFNPEKGRRKNTLLEEKEQP